MRFLLVEARVQHRMLDPGLFEVFREHFGLLDRNRADQRRLSELLLRLELLGDRRELLGYRLVEDIVLVDAEDGHVRRYRHHIHFVDVEEFRRFGHRRAGHARQLRVHAEIILEGD